ncbi:hypothetical protein JOE23_000760 [Amphibacillus cookii]|nr:hypothetical protein [Amphibacillus cookii]
MFGYIGQLFSCEQIVFLYRRMKTMFIFNYFKFIVCSGKMRIRERLVEKKQIKKRGTKVRLHEESIETAEKLTHGGIL